MYKKNIISVVIPTYKVINQIEKVVKSLPYFIDNIIVIDDKCPKKSYKLVENIDRVIVVNHNENLGVGGAVVWTNGFRIYRIINNSNIKLIILKVIDLMTLRL